MSFSGSLSIEYDPRFVFAEIRQNIQARFSIRRKI